MKVSTYDYIWNQIDKLINAIKENIESLGKDSGNNYIKEFEFKLTYGEKTKEVIKNEYILIRDELKSRCYPSALDENGNPNRIDQHKIAACFCKALIRKKVFSFKVNEKTPPEILLSNYELAYTVSLYIIYIYLEDSYRLKNQEGLIRDLVKTCQLEVPSTAKTHDQYNVGRIKTLALNDYYNIDVDILTYADMMYWIEYYNRQIIENCIKIPNEEITDVDY